MASYRPIYSTQYLQRRLQRAFRLAAALLFALFLFAGAGLRAGAQTAEIIPVSDAPSAALRLSPQTTLRVTSDADFTGAPGQLARFRGGPFGLDSGLVVSTGLTANLAGPNARTGDPSDASETLSDTLTPDTLAAKLLPPGVELYDRAALRFRFRTTGDRGSFRVVFASEEYNERAANPFSDAVGCFISGPGYDGFENVLLTPDDQPVSARSINNLINSNLYNDNTFGGSPAWPFTPYDGFTAPLDLSFDTQPCEVYTMYIVVADAGDAEFDSALLLDERSLRASGLEVFFEGDVRIDGRAVAYEGCANSAARIAGRRDAVDGPRDVNLRYGGTATEGADYAPLPASFSFQTGVNETSAPANVLADGAPEGEEYIVVEYDHPVCAETLTDTLFIQEMAPLQLNVSSDTVICAGEEITLSADGAGGSGNYTYSWNNGLGLGPVKTLEPAGSNAYTVRLTDPCVDTATTAQIGVIVAAPQQGGGPLVVENLPADTAVCFGASVSFTAAATGGTEFYAYQWRDENGDPLTPGPELTVEARDTVTYRLEARDTCAVVERELTVTPFDPVEIEVSADTTICLEGQARLFAAISGGAGDAAFEWSGGQTESEIFVSPQTTTTYTVTFDETCLDEPQTREITVTAREALSLELPEDLAFCAGWQVEITARAEGGDGDYTFNWSGGLGEGASQQLAPETDETYTVTVTDGCETPAAENSFFVRVYPEIEASFLLSPRLICQADEATALYNGDAPTEATLTWDFAGLNAAGTGGGPYALTADAPGDYRIRLIAELPGCEPDTASDLLRVAPEPVADIAVTPGDTLCTAGNYFRFMNDGAADGAAYSWDFGPQADPATSEATTQDSVQFSAAGAQTISLTVRLGNCEDSDETEVFLKRSPDAPAAFSNDTICVGESAFLQIREPDSNAVYRWYAAPEGGAPLGEGAVFRSTPLDSTAFLYAALLGANGCESFRAAVGAQVNGVTNVDFTVSDTSVGIPVAIVEFTPITSPEADYYYWDFGDGVQSTDSLPGHQYREPGLYTVTLSVTDSSGCVNSVVKPEYIDVREGVMLEIPSAFSPNDNYTNDEYRIYHRLITKFNIKIFSRWGEKVYESDDPNFVWFGEIDNDPDRYVPEGVYIYVVKATDYNGEIIDRKGTITLIR